MRSFALLFVAVAACGVEPAPQSGTIEVALVAPGAGGVSYRLPAGTSLSLQGSGFNAAFSLDGDATSASFDVPPGDYAPTLSNGQGYTSTWPLERTKADGTIDSVNAELSMPSSVTVAEGQTTNLVIHFTVAASETIVFAHGAIDTSVAVDQTTASSYRISIEVPQLALADAMFGDAAPQALQSRLEPPGTTLGVFRIDVHTIGPWRWAAPGEACADAAPDAMSAPFGGYGDLLDESFGTVATVCLIGSPDGSSAVSVSVQRAGAPKTATFSGLSDGYIFNVQAQADFVADGPLFDGDTLDLPAIPPSADTTATRVQADASSMVPYAKWYEGVAVGNGTMRFSGM